MSCIPNGGADVFACQQLIFGAYDAETSELVFVVEAESEVQGLFNADAVAPFLGYSGVWELVVVELDALPSNVPSFLRPFFDAKRTGGQRGTLVEASNTLQ